jgi:hypothetical protein
MWHIYVQLHETQAAALIRDALLSVDWAEYTAAKRRRVAEAAAASAAVPQ